MQIEQTTAHISFDALYDCTYLLRFFSASHWNVKISVNYMTKKANIKFKLMNRTSSTSILDITFMSFCMISMHAYLIRRLSTHLNHCECASDPNRIDVPSNIASIFLFIIWHVDVWCALIWKKNGKKEIHVHGLICATLASTIVPLTNHLIHPSIHFGCMFAWITKPWNDIYIYANDEVMSRQNVWSMV